MRTGVSVPDNAEAVQVNGSVARRVAWGAGSQVAARLAGLSSGIVAIGFLTRYLGDVGYGRLVTVTVYVSLFAVLFDLGISTVVVRELATRTERAEDFLGQALMLRFVLAVAVAACAGALAPLLFDDRRLRLGVLVALPSLLFGSVDSTAGAVLQAKLRMDLVAVADFVAQVGGSLLTVALVVAHAGFYAIVAVVVVTSGAHAILVFGFARRRMGLAPGVNLVVWRRLFVTALPLGVALVLNMIYVRIDVLLLSLLSGSAEVGLYGVGARFVEVAIGFPALFFAAVFPVLAGAAGVADLERLRAVAQRAFDVLVLAAVPFVLGSLLTAPEIVRLLAGGGFSGATTPLRVLSIGGGLVFVNGMLSYLLIALGRQKATFFLNLGMVTLNVGLNLVLIPRYGAVGAAWATTVSEVSILAGCSWMARSFAGFTPSLRVAWRAGLAGALMAGAVAALGAGLAASVALGAVAYGLVLAVLRVPQVLELRRLVLPHAAGRP